MGDATGQSGPKLAVAPNGDIVIGESLGGVFSFGGDTLSGVGYVAKFDTMGNHQWSHAYGGNVDGGVGITKNGEIVVVGDFGGTVDFGSGALKANGTDVYVLHLTAGGQTMWAKSYGGPDLDFVSTMALDAADDILVAGSFVGSIAFKQSMLEAAGGVNDADLFLVRLDSQGLDAWSKLVSNGTGTKFDGVRLIAPDSAGAITVAGTFGATVAVDGASPLSAVALIDTFMARWDASGKLMWAKSPDPAAPEVPAGLAPAGDGGIYMLLGSGLDLDLGGGTLAAAGGFDIIAAKLAPDGSHVWSRRFGDDQAQLPGTVDLDAEGYLVFTSDIEGSVDFGNGPLKPSGQGVVLSKLGR